MGESCNEIVLVWMDPSINTHCDYNRLMTVFLKNIDPTDPEPETLHKSDVISPLFHDTNSFIPFRIGAPCELEAFTDIRECSDHIHTCLSEGKRIYLIVSDSIVSTFLPYILPVYSDPIAENCLSIYVLNSFWNMVGKYEDSLIEYAENILVFDHDVDLLYRLERDIAQYFVGIGKKFLNQASIANTNQALTYFEWASVLLHRSEEIAVYRDSKPIRDIENLIRQAEEMISNEVALANKIHYSRAALEESLNNSLFIYASREYHSEASKLFSILHKLTDEQEIVFDNRDAFLTKLRTDGSTIQHCSPIVVSSRSGDRTTILEQLSPLSCVDYIYLFSPNEVKSTIPKDQSDIEKFSKVRNIYSRAKIVAAEWTVERASKCQEIGDVCVEHGDFDLARMYYDKAIRLNENSSVFIRQR